MTDTQRRPGLFDDEVPAFVCRGCPRCRRVKGQRYDRPRCIRCGAFLAEPSQWLWAEAWCKANVGLLRQSVKSVRPDLAGVLGDTAELVSLSLVAVLRAVLGWDQGRGTKFSTFASRGVMFAARKLPPSDGASTGVDWSRVAG
jgi:hypothetical protein